MAGRRGRGREIFRAVLGEEAAGKGGGWGHALKRAFSRVRALLPAGGAGRKEGAGAPDTCWG